MGRALLAYDRADLDAVAVVATGKVLSGATAAGSRRDLAVRRRTTVTLSAVAVPTRRCSRVENAVAK